MTLSAGTWALLLLGVILTRRWAFIERHGRVAGQILVGITLCGEWMTQCFGTDGDASQRLLTTVTALGFIAWMATLRDQSRARHWGAIAWSSAGLLILGQSTDLVMIGLGWELLRHGTRLASHDEQQPADLKAEGLLSAGWWLSVGGCLFFAGDTDITAVMQIAHLRYWPTGTDDAVDRASLLLLVAIALMVLSVIGATTLFSKAADGAATTFQRRGACGQLHVQWGVAWILATVFRTGTPGLAESLTVLLTVVILATWVGAIRTIGRAECWSELIDGAVRYHFGWVLCVTWALLTPAHAPPWFEGGFHSPASISFAWGQEVLHGAIVLTALMAAVSWFDPHGFETDYIDACRGAAASHPWAITWVVLPLASLIGLPGVWGSWTRLTSAAAMLSVQVMREDELAIPVGSSIVIALAGLIAAGYLIRAGIRVVSVLCWEPLIGRPRPPGNGWPQMAAGALSVVLLVMGCCPMLIRWLLDVLLSA